MSTGKTSYDSAVAMLVEIYGFDVDKAKKILGNVKQINKNIGTGLKPGEKPEENNE